MSMERLVEIEALSPEVARLLQILTRAKYNIFISGGTGSGKTTFLNALSQYIPDDERIITIEDSAELQLLGAKNIVRLETRNANTDGGYSNYNKRSYQDGSSYETGQDNSGRVQRCRGT